MVAILATAVLAVAVGGGVVEPITTVVNAPSSLVIPVMTSTTTPVKSPSALARQMYPWGPSIIEDAGGDITSNFTARSSGDVSTSHSICLSIFRAEPSIFESSSALAESSSLTESLLTESSSFASFITTASSSLSVREVLLSSSEVSSSSSQVSNQIADRSLPPSGEFFKGDATFYTPGLGSCGIQNTEADFVVALSRILFDTDNTGNSNNNPNCWRKIFIKKAKATRWRMGPGNAGLGRIRAKGNGTVPMTFLTSVRVLSSLEALGNRTEAQLRNGNAEVNGKETYDGGEDKNQHETKQTDHDSPIRRTRSKRRQHRLPNSNPPPTGPPHPDMEVSFRPLPSLQTPSATLIPLQPSFLSSSSTFSAGRLLPFRDITRNPLSSSGNASHTQHSPPKPILTPAPRIPAAEKRQAGGGGITVTVVDRCPGCAQYDLDLSPAAFNQLANPDAGRIQIEWQWLM